MLTQVRPVETATRPTLVKTRVFDTPPRLLFQLWTDPRHLAQWWGPYGFSNPVCQVNVRVGGVIRIHMRGPDGTIYPMIGAYREVVVPERLVFISSALDETGKPLFDVLTTATFTELEDKTKLIVHARVVRATPAASHYITGMDEGWNQSLERFAACVHMFQPEY